MKRLTILLLCATPVFAVANGVYQSATSIKKAVTEFALTQLMADENVEVKIKVGHLDSRLRLKQCDVPITTTLSGNQIPDTRFTVSVKCEGNTVWSMYVPVKVKRFTEVIVASRPITKGTVVNAAQLHSVKRDISELRHGYYQEKAPLVGMIAKRSIRAGSALTHRLIKPPIVINRGDEVNILIKTGQMEIRMEGTAINAGALGEKIRVKNTSSNKLINATVISAGLVKVGI